MPGNLREIPSSVIASWPAPNYVNPIRRTWMPAYGGVLQGLTTLMLGTRLGLRLREQAGGWGVDDALLIPAFLTATMLTVVMILGAQNYGLDRHIWDLHERTFQYTALMGWLAEIAFLVSTCCTKVSVLLFFKRLAFPAINKKWKYATIGAIVFTCCYGVAFVLALIFNCSPTQAYWRSYSVDYHVQYYCADTTLLNPLSGALSVLSDLYSVVLPMGMLWHVQSTKHHKWALNAVFSLGFIVVVAGIVRTYYLVRLGTSYDITWLGFDVLVWSQAETQLAICCACAPSLRVFFRQYLSDPLSRATHSTARRSTFRGSGQTDSIGFFGGREALSVQQTHGEITRAEGVDAKDVGCYSPAVSEFNSEQLVRTPGDFESLALETLHKQKQSQHYISWHNTRS